MRLYWRHITAFLGNEPDCIGFVTFLSGHFLTLDKIALCLAAVSLQLGSDRTAPRH